MSRAGSLGRCWGFTLMRMIKAAFLALALAGTAANSPPDVPIRLNQIGLLPDGPKRALLPDAATAPLGWTLTDAGGATVAQGKTIVIGDDAASGEHLHLIDFGGFKGRGEGFRLHVGARASRPDRKGVVSGKGVSVRVDLGGRRHVKN